MKVKTHALAITHRPSTHATAPWAGENADADNTTRGRHPTIAGALAEDGGRPRQKRSRGPARFRATARRRVVAEAIVRRVLAGNAMRSFA
jgi:hypothetical protein